MSPLAQVFVVCILVMSLVFFGSSATLYLTREDWAAEYEEYKKFADEQVEKLAQRISALSSHNELVEKDRLRLEASETQLASDLAKARDDIQAKDEQIARITSERETAIQGQTAAQNNMANLNARLMSTEQQLAAAHAAREEAITARGEADKERYRLQADLAAVRKELHDSKVEYTSLTADHETLELTYQAIVEKLGAKTVDQLLAGIVAPPIDALVEDVDPQLNMVVLSVGKKDEVKEGFEFTVYREDKFVGKVRVNSVYDNLAGAQVLFTASGEGIRQGDRATTRIN